MNRETRARRRESLKALAALALASALPRASGAAPAEALERAIPASGERIPALGMGTWLTFDVAPGSARDARLAVLREFFAAGGTLLDSSPMYGYAEAALGELVPKAKPARVFNATKVWTPTRYLGVKQMEESFRHWGVNKTVADAYYDANDSPFVYSPDFNRRGIDDGHIVSNAVRISWAARLHVRHHYSPDWSDRTSRVAGGPVGP